MSIELWWELLKQGSGYVWFAATQAVGFMGY